MSVSSQAENKVLLDVRGLEVQFKRPDDKVVRAISGIDLQVNAREVVALVGESGCGKSTTAMALMRLISPPGRIVGGQVIFNEKDVLRLKPSALRAVRGREIAIVFQNPNTYLNPVKKVGWQIEENAILHLGLSRAEARARAVETLRKVRVAAPERVANSYPHELSGGMNQRVLIAIALICEPSLIILDEPTTALDVTVQREIINLLRDLKARVGSSMVFITHDFALVAELADRVYVMYAGRVIEHGPVERIFNAPSHPYTKALLGAVLSPGRREDRLPSIPGAVPDLSLPVVGCVFRPRCDVSFDKCAKGAIPMIEVEPTHGAACLRAVS
jgi:oligopeptide/dipeptide ABC transporter ATP-binding protein